MSVYILKIIFLVALIEQNFIVDANALQQNKTTHHVRRSSMDDSFFKNQKAPSYRSFQPVSIKYHKTTYPRADDRPDYDITSYDTEYGGVVSNFTSSIYDDNPPLYPNPEFISRTNQVIKSESKVAETEVDLPDDSLADADLKEHNIIDSVTYLYGFNNCHVRNEWMILIFITCGIAILLVLAAMAWLMWSAPAADFRRGSKLYPININLCCCLAACTLIYVQAAMGVSSPSQCERVALLLHYTYLTCAMWIVALAAAVAEYCACDTLLPLKYNYLLAYGVPAVVVMFNYALSMEHYEIKHYCWMSIEKGMVMGFMVPAMVLILINTAIIILGLQSVNKKQAEMLTAKIQELVDHHIANWPKNEQLEDNKNGSIDTLNIYTPGSSRKNTDSTDTLDKEYNLSEDDCGYVNLHLPGNTGNGECGIENESNAKTINDKGLLNMLYNDNLSWKWSWNTEGNELKTYLHLCLVLEPFFAINWVMGVVAIENAAHWSTPTIYLILVVAMYVYLTVTICTTLPIVRNKNANQPCCEDVVIEPAIARTRTTDSIPLLDPAHYGIW
uniref:G-protein coupled receptors family 2 profile 2 domain-containing protein n=1 Tax=Pectinophora gossypiella TaxID=13191 RepID=A0A1E1WSN1_PECGO